MVTLKTHLAAIGVLGMGGRLLKANAMSQSPFECFSQKDTRRYNIKNIERMRYCT